MTIAQRSSWSSIRRFPGVIHSDPILFGDPDNAPAHTLLRSAHILDNSKVSVNPGLLPCFGVPGIKLYETVRREIVRLLCEEREHQKLSNYALCQRSGVSESMLSLVERGLRNPTMELMLRMRDQT